MLVQGPDSAASSPASSSRTLIYLLLLLNGESAAGMYKHRERLLVCSASVVGWGNPGIASWGNAFSGQPIVFSLLLSASP